MNSKIIIKYNINYYAYAHAQKIRGGADTVAVAWAGLIRVLATPILRDFKIKSKLASIVLDCVAS